MTETSVNKYLDIVEKTKSMTESKKDYYRGAALLDMLGYDPFDIDTVTKDAEVDGVTFDYRVENKKLVIYLKFRGEDNKLSIELEKENDKPIITVGIDDDTLYVFSKFYRLKERDIVKDTSSYLVMFEKNAEHFELLDKIEEKREKIHKVADELNSLIATHRVSESLAEMLGCNASELNKLLKVEDRHIEEKTVEENKPEEPIVEKEDTLEDNSDDEDIFGDETDKSENDAKEVVTSASDFVVPSVNKLEENDDPFAREAVDDDPFASM